MAWIESHQSLARHPKTIRAAGALKVSRPTMIGHLHLLWWWALDNADSDGFIGDVTPEMVAIGAEWPEAKGDAFLEALIASGFLEVEPDGIRLHNWARYGGKLEDRRESNRRKMAERRERERAAKQPALLTRVQNRVQHVLNTDVTRVELEERRGEETTQHNTTGENRIVAVATIADDDGPDPTDQNVLLIRHWERATGTTVPPAMADAIDAWLAQVSADWIRDAMTETGEAGVKSWRYTVKILERWKREGRDRRGADGNGAPGTTLEQRIDRYTGGALGQFVNTGKGSKS